MPRLEWGFCGIRVASVRRPRRTRPTRRTPPGGEEWFLSTYARSPPSPRHGNGSGDEPRSPLTTHHRLPSLFLALRGERQLSRTREKEADKTPRWVRLARPPSSGRRRLPELLGGATIRPPARSTPRLTVVPARWVPEVSDPDTATPEVGAVPPASCPRPCHAVISSLPSPTRC